MALQEILLELARDHDHPEGRRDCGYRFVAPLKPDGHIDLAAWRADRERCRVQRFWQHEDDEIGHLIHTSDGDWAFHYDVRGDETEDEPGYRFAAHVFKTGEYVSIREQDGTTRTFRVISVQPV